MISLTWRSEKIQLSRQTAQEIDVVCIRTTYSTYSTRSCDKELHEQWFQQVDNWKTHNYLRNKFKLCDVETHTTTSIHKPHNKVAHGNNEVQK